MKSCLYVCVINTTQKMTTEELTIVQEDYDKYKTQVCDLCRGEYNPQIRVVEEETRWVPADTILVCGHCGKETYPDDETLEEFDLRYYNLV